MKVTSKHLHDFKALELKLSEDSECPHIVYFKEHSVRQHTDDKPSGRTLLLVNIPPYANEKGLINAFSESGNIESVQLSVKPGTADTIATNKFIPDEAKPCFQVAFIVFSKVSELHKALKLTHLKPLNSPEYRTKVGLQKWIHQYNECVIQPKTLKQKIETFMKEFDEQTAKIEQKEKELEQEDDHGWVTVTKRGKVQSFARTEKIENKILQKEEKNKKRKELKNFYTFQIRESKMKHIVTLRQKFEEDKKKIALIKQSRRFKPF